MQNNINKLEGIVYAKPVRTAEGKGKNAGKTYEFPSIILEVKREYKGTVYSTLPEFEMGRGVNIDDFAIKDHVEITFALEGKKISDTWHKTTAKALYVRHADINGDDTRDVSTPQKDDVFVPPDPSQPPEADDNIPF